MALTALLPLNNTVFFLALTLLTYTLTLTLYRLYLHPLRHIPGPRIAAATWWYEVFHDVIRPGLYNFRIQELHQQYGPILRINPNEVHVADREFVGTLYDARRRWKLDDPALDTEGSVVGTLDPEHHRKRRQALVPFFSPPAVRQLEPLLRKKVDALTSMIDKALPSQTPDSDQHAEREPINLSDLYFAYAWDLILEYCFAFPSNSLSSPTESHKLRTNSNGLLRSVNFSRHFTWFNALIAHLPQSIGSYFAYPGVEDLTKIALRVRRNVDEVLADEKTTSEDVTNTAHHRSIFYSLRDEPSLPNAEKAPARLTKEGTFLVVAGSESPARSLAIIHYHVLSTPGCLQKIRAELRPLGPHPQLKDLEHVPFLNACITEGNRLSFGLTRRMSRTAAEPLMYKDCAIPPGTPVAVSSLAAMTDEEIFPEPWTFQPERWLGEGAKELRRWHCSFGFKNPRACLGIHLAEAEMRLAIAGVAKYDMELFETTGDDVAYRHDFQVAHGKLDSKGVRAFVTGREKGI